jgi:hypothetical protein
MRTTTTRPRNPSSEVMLGYPGGPALAGDSSSV